MDRQKVMFPLTYFSCGAQARRKPAIPLDLAPTKQVLPQGRFKISNKTQMTIIGKTNRLMNQEGRESYGKEAAVGNTAILQGNDDFVGAANEFEAACAEESTARERLQRAGNLTGNATGKANDYEEEKLEENVARNQMQPARNPVEQAMGEVKNIFGGGNSLGKQSALPSTHTRWGFPVALP